MNDIAAINSFVDIASKYEKFQALKEICFTYHKDGEIAIGGRKALIEDIHTSPTKYYSNGIQIVFAASSGYYGDDMPEHKNLEMDLLKNLLLEVEASIEISSWLAIRLQPALTNLSRTLVRVVCIDYRHA